MTAKNEKLSVLGIIPARYDSKRFPGKPLAMIGGLSLVNRVYRQVTQVKEIRKTIVATDDDRIFDHVNDFGGMAVRTLGSHRNGTERCSEVLELLGNENYDLVVNIQGDEPYIDPGNLRKLIDDFSRQDIVISTLATKIKEPDSLFNPSDVKVVVDRSGFALLFSRQAIPYIRQKEQDKWTQNHSYYKHIGVYGYRSAVLKEISTLSPTPLEMAESLEQLRWIENQVPVHVVLVDHDSHAIDTPEDLLNFSNNS